MRIEPNPYGTHRVISPRGVLPQAAIQLNVALPLFSNEILIEVKKLNIDSTSFCQIVKSEVTGEKVRAKILEIVTQCGKMHNPVTNSGGMLIGRVKEIGKNYQGPLPLKTGDEIATLVSLTLTPLHLEKIDRIDFKTGQVACSGHAILFETGIAASLPADIPQNIALALLDVCGAPALVQRYARAGDKILFVGSGKSARLSAAALKNKWEGQIQIHALDISQGSLKEMKQMKLADEIFKIDATSVGALLAAPELCNNYDLVVNVANVPGTEMSSILAVKERGRILFFSMATAFGKVALGAEGIGKDAEFIIGNGYAQGHAELALDVYRNHTGLRKWFEEKYKI
ncbi:MAG: L-erythro-3,5-diaminohexanoate dehydrogenase [Deltaproteobacteria bacterium]|nr:L-erythro-3,5-diaminohexanoate dehydrogenase [Deltaproteobacteria bacterium]